MASVDVATSPRKAFSLAIKGGLKEVWAEGRWVNDRDIVVVGWEVLDSRVEDLGLGLVLLRKEPMLVSFCLWQMMNKSRRKEGECRGQRKRSCIHTKTPKMGDSTEFNRIHLDK